MLTITIEKQVLWNDETQEFVDIPPVTLDLEHSLVSLSKWESIHEVPFLSPSTELTPEMLLDYLKCMVITPGVDPAILVYAATSDMERIQDYIGSTQSATTFKKLPEGKGGREQITSELIHFWMNHYGIAAEAEGWHLNRLFSLIRIHSVKNADQKKQQRPASEIAAERRAENERRRKEWNSTG